jgi:hypothetical protein
MGKWPVVLCGLAVTALPAGVFAGEFEDAMKGGKAYVDLRYRLETVDQENFTKDAYASILRTKLGYKTGEFKGFHALAEIENSTLIGDDTYNDTLNNRTNRPTIADTISTEVNQAYLSYAGVPHTTITAGRMGINLDNQRFIGTVGWRQNDQTFDAITVANTLLPDTTAVYGYVTNVNRIFSDDAPLGNLNTDAHLINVSYDGFDLAKITAYGYLLEVNDSQSISAQTYGLRAKGKHPINDDVAALYTAEFAKQKDYGDNTANYDLAYYLAEAGVKFRGFTVKAGFESLEGDGTTGFGTPLATGHAFNGWADLFLNTPANGLEDAYGVLAYKTKSENQWLDGIVAKAIYHDFSAENGGADYGSEWNFLVKKDFLEHYGVLVKYATYDADTFGNDVQKLWVQFSAKF